jgi:pimeloyl-ACP methyl ester carboxylesterase
MIGGVAVRYHERGSGVPVLILHGAGVDHREMAAALEPLFEERSGYRRIYVDLPGMGETPAPEALDSNDAVLDLLIGVADDVVGDDEFLVVGHSYGGYLGRGIANRYAHRVAGLALICPATDRSRDVPEHVALHTSGDLAGWLDPVAQEEFREYFVVHTPETVRRFQEAVAPAKTLVDRAALMRIFGRWRLRDEPEDRPQFTRPVLILTGRQDSVVGWVDSWRLLDHYPRATFAVLDRAGHALAHEQGPLLVALMAEWLDRVDESRDRR